MEDLAYRRLLDVYYMREGALPADIQVTAKLVRLRSCAADVESVLNEFFVLTEDGWRHQRCEREIEKMQDKQAKARASAQASVNSRRAKAERTLDESPTDVERSLVVSQTDVELPTPTPTPINTTAKAVVGAKRRKPQVGLPDDFAPNEVGLTKAAEKHLDVQAEMAKFRNYHEAKGSVMADWQAAWRTWVGNARPGTTDAAGGSGPKRGTDEYAALHKSAGWWREAGFASVWDADASKCWHDNADKFRDGKRVEVAA